MFNPGKIVKKFKTKYANNPRAIHLYQKLGFKKIGVLPKAWLYKGKYVDDIMMYLKL